MVKWTKLKLEHSPFGENNALEDIASLVGKQTRQTTVDVGTEKPGA